MGANKKGGAACPPEVLVDRTGPVPATVVIPVVGAVLETEVEFPVSGSSNRGVE